MIFRAILAHPCRVLIGAAWVLIGGILALISLERSDLPRIDIPCLIVSTSWPGVSASEMERLVGIPLEDSLASLPGLRTMETTCRTGLAITVLELRQDSDILSADTACREIVDSRYPTLPEGVGKPRISRRAPDASPLMVLAIEGLDVQGPALRRLVRDKIAGSLRKVPGVGTVTLVGGQAEEIRIEADPALLLSRGLSLDDLGQAVSQAWQRKPLGTIRDVEREVLVVGNSEGASTADLESLPLSPLAGSDLHLADLARVQRSLAPPRSQFLASAGETVGLMIQRQNGRDPVQCADAIHEAITRLNAEGTGQYHIRAVQDDSGAMREAIDDVWLNLALGAAFAWLIVLLFTRDLRFSFLLLTSLPISLLLALGAFRLAGLSLNVMSLSGLAITVGNLLDSSTVALEALRPLEGRGTKAAARCLQGLFPGLLGGTMTSMIVFVPVMFMPELVGQLYRELAMAICLSQIASLLVALSTSPVFCLLFASKAPRRQREQAWGKRCYHALLRRIMALPPAHVRLIPLVLLPLSLASFLLVPLDPAPPAPGDVIEYRIPLTANVSAEAAMGQALAWRDFLSRESWVENFWLRHGAEDDDLAWMTRESQGDEALEGCIVIGRPWRTNATACLQRLEDLSPINGLDANVRPSAASRLLGLGEGGGSRWLVQSPQRKDLENMAGQIDALADANIRREPASTARELQLLPRPERCARLGLDALMLARTVNLAVQGRQTGYLDTGVERLPIRLTAPLARIRPETLGQVPLMVDKGVGISLDQLADLTWTSRPSVLYRVERQASMILRGPKPQLIEQLRDSMPPGISIKPVDADALQRNLGGILAILALALLFLFLYLAAQFESPRIALLILVTLPLSAPGAMLGLALTGESLHLHAIVGLVVLAGIVVNSAILLHEGSKGMAASLPARQRVLRAALQRYRPIMLTVLSTILALLPLASGVLGAREQRGMSALILGGLGLSTLLGLVLVPLVLAGEDKR